MVQDGGQVLHAEPGGTFTPVWVVLAVMALGTAIDAVVRSPGDALSIVVAGTTVLIPVGLYVASKRRYGRLEVTRDTLRIGKERFPLADLDPEPLEEQAAEKGEARVRGKPPMVAISLEPPSEDAPRAPEGVGLHAEYGGPHGPVFTGYGDERHTTRVWGPHVPDSFLGVGPVGRRDGEPVAFYMRPVPIRVGPLSGEVVRADWALLNRRRRGIVISLDSRSYLYRVPRFVARQLLERGDGTPVTILSGLTGENQIAEDADAVDVAVSLLIVYGIPISAIKAQA